SLVGPVQYRVVVQINSRSFEDRDLTIDRQVVYKLPNDQHCQHRCAGNTLFNSPVRKLSDRYAFSFLTNVLATHVTLHIELRSLYLRYLGNFVLQTGTTTYIFSRLNDNRVPAQR